MAGSGVGAGHDTRLYLLWEDNGFASSSNDSENKPLGWNVQMTTAEGSNALRRIFMPGSRTAVDQIAMLFEGSFSVQFTLSDPWYLDAILGSSTQTDNSDGSYTYNWTNADPQSFQLVEGHVESGKERVLKGCVVTRMTIDASIEEEAQVTLEGAYADEEIRDPGALPNQPTPSHDPLTYVEGAVIIDKTTEGYVQSMTLTVEANVDMIREMGSRFPIDFNDKVLTPSVDFSALHDGDEANLESFYGTNAPSSPAEDPVDGNKVSLEMSFDNGKTAGNGINKHTYAVTGTATDTFGEGGIGDPRADLEETVNRAGEDLDVYITNEVGSAI